MKVPRRHVEAADTDTIMGCLGYTSPDGGINENNNWCHIPQARGGGANLNEEACLDFLANQKAFFY